MAHEKFEPASTFTPRPANREVGLIRIPIVARGDSTASVVVQVARDWEEIPVYIGETGESKK